MRFSAAITADRLLPAPLARHARPMLNKLDGVLFSPDERGAAGRMTMIAFAIRVVSAAIAFGSQVILARAMGSFDYGIFVLVWTTVVIAGSLSCLGFHASIVRFVPEYSEKGMLAEMRGVVLASRRFVLFASTFLTASGLLAFWFLSDRVEPFYVTPFLVGILCVPMIALSDALGGLARAQSWPVASLAPVYLVRPLLLLLVMLGAIAFGYPPDANTGAVSALLATYATALGQFVGISGATAKRTGKGPSKLMVRHWLAVSFPIFLVEGFFFLITNADVLMVGVFMPPHDVAVYFATVKTLALVHFVYFAVKAGTGQRFAQFAQGDRARLASLARDSVSWTFWPSLLLALAVLALGKPLLSLFGPDFAAGYPLLLPLLLGVSVRAAVGPAETLLNMTGHQNACAAVFALTLALNVGLSIVLIPAFGLWGAAFATALSILFEAASLAATVWWRLGIAMFVFAPKN